MVNIVFQRYLFCITSIYLYIMYVSFRMVCLQILLRGENNLLKYFIYLKLNERKLSEKLHVD